VSTEKIHRLQGTSDKLVWCLQIRSIVNTGLVLIN
jgi:hypothetical protein